MVLVGDETRLGGIHQHDQSSERQSERSPHEPLVLDEEHDAVLVFADDGAERRIERLAEAGGEVVAHLAVLVHIGLHDDGAERGRQRKGVERGDADGDGHGQTELRVEDARRTAHHGDGDEDGHEDQRRSDDSRSDARHGVDGGHVRRLVPGVETRLHGLDDDDGVVDDGADGEHEGEQRQEVDGEPGDGEEREGTDKCDENRNRGNQRGPDVLQEDVDDQHDEDDGLEEGFDDLVDGSVEKVVDVLKADDFDALGQLGADFVEQVLDVLDDLRGVGPGGLEDHGGDAGVAVGVALIGIGLAAELDVGDLAEPQHLPVGGGADDDIAELLGRHPAAAVLHGILERVVGILAQLPHRRLDVLLGERVGDVGRNEPVLRHDVGPEPDTHGVIGAQGHELAHARDALHAGFDVDVHVVGQEGLVVRVVGAVEHEDLQHGGLPLEGLHADAGNLGGKYARCV